MSGSNLPLPTFLIIGAQKSATRWLRHNLGEHRDVYVAPSEVKYFNHPKRVAALGTDWYREQFAGWRGEPIVGEATPGYMIPRHSPDDIARRVHDTLGGDVRLIALLRNPVDRAQSALVHHVRYERIHPKTQLIDLVRSDPPEARWMAIVDAGRYAESLESYRRVFGDGLLVLLHDDVGHDPRRSYSEALAHIGARGDFVPPALAEVRNSNQDGETAAIPADVRRELFEYFRDDVERLEDLLGRDLSCWRPPGTFPTGGAASGAGS
jgi:hypothetical protein